ncbi:hypothetical protein CHS0354_037349 [Potamilus streckersoni]|uniref:Uncharacterized protein n=1 Tax=Potamilus streckersoni TaxID=2493646 RepID=A0AAE0S4F2_9BIVA|nr:hypothetical protein CHS0354_037349 [Potamilus streckersoni]
MFTRDAITAAVACSCLFFMVANQSVNACSCYEAIDANETCLAKEIWEITVTTKERREARGDDIHYQLYGFHFNNVTRSFMNYEEGNEAYFKISYHSSCIFNFTNNATYFIAAESTSAGHSPVKICNKEGNSAKYCKRIRLLVKMQKTKTE